MEVRRPARVSSTKREFHSQTDLKGTKNLFASQQVLITHRTNSSTRQQDVRQLRPSKVPASTRACRISFKDIDTLEADKTVAKPNPAKRVVRKSLMETVRIMSSQDDDSTSENFRRAPQSYRLSKASNMGRIKLSEDGPSVAKPETASVFQSSREAGSAALMDAMEMHIPLLSNVHEHHPPAEDVSLMNEQQKKLHLESVQRRRFTLLAGKIENLPGVKSTGMDSTVKQVYNKYGHVTNLKEIRRKFFDQLEEKFYLKEKYELRENQKQTALITALANNNMRLKREEKRKGQLDWFSIAGGTNKNVDWTISNPITPLWVRAQKKYEDYKASQANTIKQDVTGLFELTAAFAIEKRLEFKARAHQPLTTATSSSSGVKGSSTTNKRLLPSEIAAKMEQYRRRLRKRFKDLIYRVLRKKNLFLLDIHEVDCSNNNRYTTRSLLLNNHYIGRMLNTCSSCSGRETYKLYSRCWAEIVHLSSNVIE